MKTGPIRSDLPDPRIAVIRYRRISQTWAATPNNKINGRFLYRPVFDFRITLEARNPARRCSRRYCVGAGTDLSGVWAVEIAYGRIGTVGRSRRERAPSPQSRSDTLLRLITLALKLLMIRRVVTLSDSS